MACELYLKLLKNLEHFSALFFKYLLLLASSEILVTQKFYLRMLSHGCSDFFQSFFFLQFISFANSSSSPIFPSGV